VIDFMNFRHKDMAPNTKFSKNYLWFAGLELPKIAWQNLFISCWYWTDQRTNFFYSAQDVVEIILMKILLPLLNMFLWVWMIKQVIR
jgi:hypothetical protein